ncbi:MAG: phosphoglucomutase/phosphomannomutase family protein [Clostridia bacterium]|nr:phosphoglucomutase/phosphomannomutase family protein [Clostridia bacterium]
MISFGTGGFRGVIGEDFTEENVRKIAQGLCDTSFSNGWNTPVVIGYDRRFMSDYFAGYMAEVFTANGIKVLLMDRATPTPVVMSATKKSGFELGVMITASHNPYIFNGVKVFLKGGVDADEAFTSALEKTVNAPIEIKSISLDNARKAGLFEKISYVETYLDDIEAFIDPRVKNNDVKILFDNMYGVGIVGLTGMAERLRIKRFDIVGKEHDAFFGFVPPNPTEDAMSALADAVRENGYDLAIATDSDADRLGVLDENGKPVSSNEILACLYYYLVRYRGMEGDAVKNCATSVLLDKVAEKLGYECHETDVGFKNISAGMKKYNALIGGESSGGLTVRGYISGKDSTFSASLFIEMCVMLNKPLSEIVDEVKRFAGYDCVYREREITVKNTDPNERLYASCVESFGADSVVCFGRNVKIYLGGGWALVRASGTEPVIRIFAEMPTAMEADAIIINLIQKITEADKRG